MALVEQSENCKAAASYGLRAASGRKIGDLLEARSEHGAEIAEVALVLPLVFMFLLGIVWFGRAFNIYATITQAAQQGAITAARSSCATCTGSSFPPASAAADKVAEVLQASSLDPDQIINYRPNTLQSCVSLAVNCDCNSRNVCVCSSVLLNPVSTANAPPQPAQCGTLVSFQYPFQFYLPFTSLNQRQIVLTAQAQSRMEQ
jgi:hypothetical protein